MKNTADLINELPNGIHENLKENSDGANTLIKHDNSRILFLDGVIKIEVEDSITLENHL